MSVDNSLYTNYKNIIELDPSKDLSKDGNGNPVSLHKDMVNKVNMLVFYAPWCGHCRHMVDDLVKLSDDLSNEGFKIGTVNCDKYVKQLNNVGINIQGYPTIYFSNISGVSQYNGSRTVDDLLDHLCTNLKTCLKK